MNLEAEERNGYLVSSEMKSVWNVELMLLRKLLAVCEENNLTIWVSAGTLLGTIREKGFIPWDDDIDVEMPRKDYDRLKTIARNAFSAPYFFQSGRPTGFSQLKMDGTSAIHGSLNGLFLNVHQGIGIDIFPLDLIPDSPQERALLNRELNKRRRVISDYAAPSISLKFKSFFRIILNRIRISIVGLDSYLSKYDSIVSSFQDMDFKEVGIYSVWDNERTVRNRDWYSGTIHMPFEDISVPVPVCYQDILSKQYGSDYMTPKQVSSTHNGFLIMSTTQSYKDLIPQLRRQYKRNLWTQRIKHLFCILKIDQLWQTTH